jgi:hypothetical protein
MPSIYPGRLPGRYVAILRAEVYLRTNAQLNAMISE